jgi:hypothetical protein
MFDSSSDTSSPALTDLSSAQKVRQINDPLSPNSEFFGESSVKGVLDRAWQEACTKLSEFASNPDLIDKMDIAFGPNFDVGKALNLSQGWAVHNFDNLPNIQIRSSMDIAGGNGAFCEETNTTE